MFKNPLIQRYRYSSLRPKQFWIYVTIYICVALLIISLNYLGYKYQTVFKDIYAFFKSIFYQFLTFQTIILLIWGAYNSGSAIKEEILNKSIDFFKLLPLPAYKKALGIMVGKNLVTLLFAIINFALLLFFGFFGNISLDFQIQLILVLISATILINSISLLYSMNATKRRRTSPIVLILFAVFFFIPILFNAIGFLSRADDAQDAFISFYSIEIPALLLIFIITSYFSVWAFKGILRKFTYEQDPLFTRKGAILFLIGYIAVVIGLHYDYLEEPSEGIIASYWLISLVPLIVVPLGSLRNFYSYIEYSRLLQGKASPKKNNMVPLFFHSNLFLGILLFAIWMVPALQIACFKSPVNIPMIFYDVFILFTFYLFLIILLELYTVYMSAPNKINILLGFVAALYLILPLILSGIFDYGKISFFSPIGFLGAIFDSESNDTLIIKTSVLIINILFCIVPAILIYKRYKLILAARQRM